MKQYKQYESELIEAEMRKIRIQQEQKQQQEEEQGLTHSELFTSLLRSSMGSGQHDQPPAENKTMNKFRMLAKALTSPITKTRKKTTKPTFGSSKKAVPAGKNKSRGKKIRPPRRSKAIRTAAATTNAATTNATAKKAPPPGSSLPLAETVTIPEDATATSNSQSNSQNNIRPPQRGKPVRVATTAKKARRKTNGKRKAKSNDKSNSSKALDSAASILMKLSLAPNIYPIGTRTKKFFKEHEGWFMGIIRSYNQMTEFYSVEYEDSDKEELEHHEIDTGPLPPHKYDIGTQYEVSLVSKEDGTKLGWFVGTIQSKYFHVPKLTRWNRETHKNGQWRYNVVYSDGDSEDADEDYITKSIEDARHKRGRRKVELPEEELEFSRDRGQEQQPIPDENTEESALDDSSSESSSDSSDSDEESSSEDEGDRNPNNIPHWTGKQHQQLIVGLRKFGLGNLEDIHEADCIPSRSFQELVRYWRWYESDLLEKGLALNYETKGTVNGKQGTRFFNGYGIDGKGNTDDADENENDNDDDDDGFDGGFQKGPWSDHEKEMVVKAYAFQGNSYKAMCDYMKTRNVKQIAGYFIRHKAEIIKKSLMYTEEANSGESDGDNENDGDTNDDGNNAIDINNNINKDVKVRIWSPAEHTLVVEALAAFGRNFNECSEYMKRRKPGHINKYMKRNSDRIWKDVKAQKKNFPKRTGAWSPEELSMLVEGHAVFGSNFELIAVYVKSRDAGPIESLLEANAAQYKDESAFDLGDHFSFPIELFHVLNVALFEGFESILSWNDDGDRVIIHDNNQFANRIFPRYSYKGTSVQKFYDNLKLFGFKKSKGTDNRNNKVSFHHPAFRRGNYRKVEQHTQKVYE